jgi:hypothetical protein
MNLAATELPLAEAVRDLQVLVGQPTEKPDRGTQIEEQKLAKRAKPIPALRRIPKPSGEVFGFGASLPRDPFTAFGAESVQRISSLSPQRSLFLSRSGNGNTLRSSRREEGV